MLKLFTGHDHEPVGPKTHTTFEAVVGVAIAVAIVALVIVGGPVGKAVAHVYEQAVAVLD